jgi:serine phosphatase RsbU (regulator of sigma subunit)
MALVAKRRYTDHWARARRSVPLSPAAEIQWDLLPPLTCTTAEVAVGGILEPAYDIGGDSFDYAVNQHVLQLAIVDAIGHGMPAVLMSTAAINSLRNSRRAGSALEAAYGVASGIIESQFGDSLFVTAQIASLDLATGLLTWVNAGHVPPLLIRNGAIAGELRCQPSLPLGLGGRVVETATTALQSGDRVLFYTDGLTEGRSPDGTRFGEERLADYLVRSSLDRVPVAETARRLAAHVMDHVGHGLDDDATILLVEYRGPDRR